MGKPCSLLRASMLKCSFIFDHFKGSIAIRDYNSLPCPQILFPVQVAVKMQGVSL